MRPVIITCLVVGSLSCVVPREEDGGQNGSRRGTRPIDSRGVPRQAPLAPPSATPLPEFERKLYEFIRSRKYDTELSWMRDKGVRDTGPWVQGKYYGTHAAVRIYYSPRVMYWLTGDPSRWPEGRAAGLAERKGPREGAVPDGGMIVKEMFHAPAARYDGFSDTGLVKALGEPKSPGWAVMVKDSAGSKDGWFYTGVFASEKLDTGAPPFAYPNSGFGLYCLNCHASAKRESTFSSLKNIEGFPGEPDTFLVDDTWRSLPTEGYPWRYVHGPRRGPTKTPARDAKVGGEFVNEEFLRVFNTLPPVASKDVVRFPSESLDHIVAGPEGPEQFLTSDQCLGCHAGSVPNYGAFGPIMALETGPEKGDVLNLSPYGEWRWSPMGLGGRDPIFHAQLESELSILRKEFPDAEAKLYADQTVNTCLLCHGAMGKRQLDRDRGVGDEYWEKQASFQLDWYFDSDPQSAHFKYGALGRDGISCTACHHVEQEYKDIEDFLRNSITGQFRLSPPDELQGPFEKVATLPMENALGITPKHDPYIKSSRMCGSCHTIVLPVVDYPLDDPPEARCEPDPEPDPELNKPDKNPHFEGFLHKVEQATYLEWLNSSFQNEFDPWGEKAKSCQDCHMPTGYTSPDGKIDIKEIQTKIAYVEDQDFPTADNRADTERIHVEFRKKGYRRHRFQGLNVFLAEMFRQFNGVLGVRLENYMTGTTDLDFAIENFIQNALNRTAELKITRFEVADGVVTADVLVTNNTGHRFPSGVGFRRAFIEFKVVEAREDAERVVWSSGRTNSVGVILGPDGEILPSEFLTDGRYHEHRRVIDEETQVQVYEELTRNAKGDFTTSFIHRDCEVKDNRILPHGWSPQGPSPAIPEAYIKATHPGPSAKDDPEYGDGSGTDLVTYRAKLPEGTNPENVRVVATLYSQSWAPYYLHQRFSDVPPGPDGNARRRLYFLASHLDLRGTKIENWKLELASDFAPKK